ncbi:DUF1992 domain-containing protein [Propionivibrio dicarboxylicus]|uniref:DnaJ homologue subfamily C member 28 conserved domain-containing protein n=1 Tax=Propionivibrio dicarboxylicus TaxID=83767 RepID=A0A1G7XTH1_9RHOO|nr:DUF1992 domain-containing protein [Propionivibrio dicarboxylicus]SDG87505.1 protein of unknown function [Propionivibrio dicarboxylicus]
MLFFEILAEQKIRDAIANGDLDDLPGAGQPLDLVDEPFVSPEQRMVNHILKRAGLVPSEVSMRQAVARLREEIRQLPADQAAAQAKRRELSYLLVQLGETRCPVE